ncbi:MAG: leucine-rich repeat domain-containing protein [Clostridia bacterium]|nr:leucine-rich repeat domain-containing protein [Clostridia bacterium]
MNKKLKIIIPTIAAIAVIVTIIVIITTIAITSVSIFLLSNRTSPVDDFEYEMDDGEITITAYIGVDRKINIPKKINGRPVTIIGPRAFQKYDMTHISIPNTVREIHENAFDRCTQLKSIEWSKNLEYIGYSAFSYCSSLKKLNLPDSLLTIQDDAFYSSGVSKVILPESLEFLGLNAFANCKNLDSLKIPDNTDIDFHVYTPWNYYIEGYDSICELSCPVGTIEVGIYNNGKDYDIFYSSNGESGITTELIISKNSVEYDRVVEYMESYGLEATIK